MDKCSQKHGVPVLGWWVPALSRGSSSGFISHSLGSSNIDGVSHILLSVPKLWPSNGNREGTVLLPQVLSLLSKPCVALEPFRIPSGILSCESADVGSRWWGEGGRGPHCCLASSPRKTAHHTTCHIKSLNSCLQTLVREPPSATHMLLPGTVQRFLPPWVPVNSLWGFVGCGITFSWRKPKVPTLREKMHPSGFSSSGSSSSFLPSPNLSITTGTDHCHWLNLSHGRCSMSSVYSNLCNNLKISHGYAPFMGEESALRILLLARGGPVQGIAKHFQSAAS